MRTMLKHKLLIGATLSLILVALFIVLGNSKAEVTPPPASPPEVETAQVEQKDVPIYSEWIGTLDGMVNAEIKAQVTGYLLNKNYTEGSFVKKGQLLFEIDPRPFQAALDQAKSELAKAQGQLAQANGQLLQSQAQFEQARANQGKTQLDQDRYSSLVSDGVISRQEFETAVQFNLASKAQVEAARAGISTAKAAIEAAGAAVESARASVQTAELNLGFTRIISPIDGIAGIAQAQVGNLVNPNSGTLATVSTLDPIKVYFALSEQEYLNFARINPTQSERDAASRKLELELVLADGTIYPQKGRFYVTDREVDEKTGSIRLAGIFPNPGNTLRPGQYGRIRTATSMKKDALLVPQRAIAELQGSYQVSVVEADNKVGIRTVKLGERIGAMRIIDNGLKPGESVIVEGAQKVRPGILVNPKLFASQVQ